MNTEPKEFTEDEYNKKFEELCRKGRIKFITFHPSYSYEEFIEGITAETRAGQVNYYVKEGIFKRLCKKALLNILKNNSIHVDEDDCKKWSKVYKVFDKHRDEIDLKKGEPFVLIIDEINRGNISKIFGELITLIEDDKRLGGDCEITSILPYTRQRFGVPPNIYILATMNTADRSIALLDVALRRRFKFVEMPPEFEKMKEEAFYRDAGSGSLLHISVDALIRINDELCKLKRIGKDRRIGHSYFWNKKDDNEVLEVWKTEILPLMEEYMYGDYEELQKCFGDKVIDKYTGVSQKITIEILENSLKNNVLNWSPSSV
ncbi:MAG: AAA family ATPase [Candidatus Aenigmarchaeota archaeon]|nr:AAA family ATPase [Candidatus Aenigmarchaeota archaeon]